MDCPKCGKEFEDFDGVGVVYCDPAIGGCGFCRHLARSGGVCDYCHDTKPTLFYMQDARQCVGNCILWWRDGGGYTTELAEAELFTAEQCKGKRDTDIPWERKLVLSAVCTHVRMEHLAVAAEKLKADGQGT